MVVSHRSISNSATRQSTTCHSSNFEKAEEKVFSGQINHSSVSSRKRKTGFTHPSVLVFNSLSGSPNAFLLLVIVLINYGLKSII